MLSISNSIPTLAPTETWHEITAGPDVTFAILVRSPTLADTLGELGAISRGVDDPFGAQAVHRIRASVIDWRDVTDESGSPIPFSWDVFAGVLMKFPAAMRAVTNVVYDCWQPSTEDSEKN